MSFFFEQSLVTNSSNGRNLRRQYDFQSAHRQMFDMGEKTFAQAGGMVGNAAARIPQEVYREFDRIGMDVMRADQGDVLLNDLMPLSRSLDIGKILHEYRQTSSAGAGNTTLSGLEPIPNDQVRFSYDGAIVPVHQSGFFREWRELAGMRSEDFDALIDDQEASVRHAREMMVDYVLDGKADLSFKGHDAYGIRNGANTVKVDLDTLITGGIDFTSEAASGKDIRNAFKALRDKLAIDNNVTQDITFYVSRQMMSNFERYYSDQPGSRTILEELRRLDGVGAIKKTSKLNGNELIGGVLNNQFIVPLTAQALSTIMMPRQTPFARHQGIVWSAMGIEIRTDYAGRSGWMYAASGAAP